MSTKQHVGTQSDALVADPDVEAMRAALAAKRAAVRPAGKRFSGVSAQGDGDWCPVPGHGRKYWLGTKQWCPHQEHDAEILARGIVGAQPRASTLEHTAGEAAHTTLPDLDIDLGGL